MKRAYKKNWPSDENRVTEPFLCSWATGPEWRRRELNRIPTVGQRERKPLIRLALHAPCELSVTFCVTPWGAKSTRNAGIDDPFAELRVESYGWESPSPRSTQMSTEQIERELLRLPASERARLAERLIASLDEDAEIDRAWVEEVRRRDQGLDSGAVQSLPLEDSLRDLRYQLGW